MFYSSPGVLGLYWYSSCFISQVFLSREPAFEYGASACPRGPGFSVSRVSLSIEPTREYGASQYKQLSCSMATVTLFIDPAGG